MRYARCRTGVVSEAGITAPHAGASTTADHHVERRSHDQDALLDGLDPAQRQAVTTPSMLVAVIAGAGSGKTRVLTHRVAWRIAAETAHSKHTLVLTFTREAAGELRRRLRRFGVGTQLTAGTFHSVMLAMLRQYASDRGHEPPSILNSRHRLLGELMDRRTVNAVADEAEWCAARAVDAERYAAVAAQVRRRPPLDPEAMQNHLVKFRDEKRRRRMIDINDVLVHALGLLERDAAFADAMRWRFRHLFVDEAQDLNPVQHRLVDALRTGSDDLFLVGDPAQAIYGFNGADPALLVDVEQRFPGIEIISLPSNHRCTPQVVELGTHVLRRAGQPADVRSTRGDGPAVSDHHAADEDAEAELVASLIVELDPSLIRTSSIAVLARTRAQLPPLERAIAARGVEVRRRVDAPGTALATAINSVVRLGSAGRLRAWAHDILDAPPPPPAPVAVDLPKIEADGEVLKNRAHDAPDEPDPERVLAAAVLEFLREHPDGDGAALRGWLVSTDAFGTRNARGVELLTFHAAKGREWHTVILAGVETSLVPHKSASTNAARAEEARLLYVAATRATDRLVITRAERRGGYARGACRLIDDFPFGDPPPVRPPRSLVARATERSPADGALDRRRDALRDWRQLTARRAGLTPEQLCTDAQLRAIAEASPTTADELADATGVGRLTAAQWINGITRSLSDADAS